MTLNIIYFYEYRQKELNSKTGISFYIKQTEKNKKYVLL
jgi:hypothetical protein